MKESLIIMVLVLETEYHIIFQKIFFYSNQDDESMLYKISIQKILSIYFVQNIQELIETDKAMRIN